MLNAFVSGQDYNGYGGANDADVAELRKALSAGSDQNDPGTAPGVGFPLRVESLEATLKNLTYEMDEIKLFKSINKVPASNTVEEFNQLVSYGAGGARSYNQGFFPEGDLPEEQDSTYKRAAVFLKYLGITGRVTHVASTVKSAHGDAIALETMNKTMELLRNLENSLFFGDSSMIPDQWDGLQKLITDGAPDNVIDLRGAPLSEDALNDMLLTIRYNYGQATDAYFGTGAFADLAKQVYDRQRFAYAPAPGVLGATVSAFQGQNGRINLHDHVFINQGGLAQAAGVGRAVKRPLQPSISVQPAAGADASSLFVAADVGSYTYRIVAGNRFGSSTPVSSNSIAVAAGEAVTFTIVDGGQDTSFYEVYRSGIGEAASEAKLITKVARTGANQVVTDLNADLPGTSNGFVLQQNQRSMSWAQLLPMTRVPLAAIDTSVRWTQVIYGGVKLYTPGKNIVVKNIGRAAGSLGV